MSLIYKILTAAEWAAAQGSGRFEGSPVDHADGYIHFSTGAQLRETGRRYFSGQADLILLVIETEPFGDAIRWEPSRGGDLFPHLYSPLPVARVIEARALPLGPDGAPDPGETP